MATLYLVRHGRTEWSDSRRFCGSSDPPLTLAGAAEVQALGAWLSREPVPTAIFTSPRQRARMTADLLASTWPHAATAPVEARIAETDFGRWEGLKGEEIQQHDPGEFARWCSDPVGFEPPGGESVARLDARVQSLLHELEGYSGERVALVSHGGPIRILVLRTLGLPLTYFWHFNPPWASVSLVYNEGQIRRLEYFGQRG